MAEPTHPWDQQPGEPNESFARFLLYRNIGPGRSQQAAYDTYLATFRNAAPAAAPAAKGAKKPQVPGHWNDDSARWRWVDRATTYDLHVLHTHGERLAVLWVGILSAAAEKCAQKLADPRCKPRDFMQCVAVIDKLAAFLSPDAVKSLQPPAPPPGPRRQPEPADVR